LVKIDFKNYFDQINSQRIGGMLHAIGLPAEVVKLLLPLCTPMGALPQGAATSPILANMVTFRLDKRLRDYGRSNRLRYTRYADDLVFSSHSRPLALNAAVERNYARLGMDDLRDDLLGIFKDENFEINPDKLYYCGPSARRAVTGYTINSFENVPRRHVRRVRSIIHNIRKNGYDSEQAKYSALTGSIRSLRRSLRGQIEWIGYTKGKSDPVFRRYALDYNKIFHDQISVGPNLDELAQRSTWVLEAFKSSTGDPISQGSCFFLESVGLVTAAHCVPANCSFEVFCILKPAERFQVHVSKIHLHIDLAVLQHTIPADRFIPLKRGTRDVNIGEEVRVWGFPDYGPGKDLTRRFGRVIGTPVVSAVPMYEVDQKIYQGNSGGPLLDHAGRVVGVCHKGGVSEAHDLAVKHTQLDLI
jgi:S1-C subfamily serine protease